MYQNRTYQDLLNYNPLMKNTYFEVEKTRKDDPQPPRFRTHQLVKIPVIMDDPPDAPPRALPSVPVIISTSSITFNSS